MDFAGVGLGAGRGRSNSSLDENCPVSPILGPEGSPIGRFVVDALLNRPAEGTGTACWGSSEVSNVLDLVGGPRSEGMARNSDVWLRGDSVIGWRRVRDLKAGLPASAIDLADCVADESSFLCPGWVSPVKP
ncbi:hypothetical protein PHLCEN_2v5325 [Hermanssonia centrifuga]|uniref:Uncharacterized protein n=1 Tax=Hermanssonia centrifuga TaxID=98765 RepID=A0A2R6P5I7_9APHY|nr:hypothetical protein PHLCEN_2v5325 [Hermanssonia centrifuga]